ncbi:hypothetical protein [Desulfuribacillus alkaliarsenatis]|uniref:hypothetical protein n=1 Tax=Desulfuribacillus alkaliarsenatis TaxID=766136 RepID=UPI0015B63BC9|nr:hypothetical protein [Desulfuribacillus alkaliarsenatis]
MLSNILFVIFAVVHLITREWPFGTGLQPILDVLFIVVTFLLIAKYLGENKD